MNNHKTPGVYIEEQSLLGSSVVQVDTAVPGFVGYTEKAPQTNTPTAISSMLEYNEKFGGAYPEQLGADLTKTPVAVDAKNISDFKLYYHLQQFFANGGGKCYVVSVGNYPAPDSTESKAIDTKKLTAGITTLEKISDLTLLVVPEAVKTTDWKTVYETMLNQCGKLKDRFSILDVPLTNPTVDDITKDVSSFRQLAPQADFIKYGAAYTPYLHTSLSYAVDETKTMVVTVAGTTTTGNDGKTTTTGGSSSTLADLKTKDSAAYHKVVQAIGSHPLILSPSASMAGVYAQVDANRGVWKAPANVALQQVVAPSVMITEQEQEALNVDSTSGKSIDAIRSFPGKGTLVWGARTLDGNSNDWRYVPVKRLFIMIETSVKRAIEPFVFEPNTEVTWMTIETQISSFLTDLWRQGALVGTTAEQAFYVNLGLGKTMTEVDIQAGKMIVEVGLAPSRPAEFIVLRFSQKLQQAAA